MSVVTHFCLVSAQAAPNLLPLLDEAVKPKKVVLLVTPEMKKKAELLESVIKPRGIKVEQKVFEVSDNFEYMQNQLMDLIEQENESADNIALNATGGTKWMAIAAQEVFRMNGSPVFYVDVADDKLLFVDSQRQAHTLSQTIGLKTYVEAYGYEFREPSQAQGLSANLRDLCQQMVLNVEVWQSAIGQLNLLASTAEQKQSLSVSMKDLIKSPDAQLQNLLSECQHAGLLELQGESIRFKDEEGRTFANGGWLEFYVNDQLNSLRKEKIIQERPYLNLEIQRQDKTSHNEVDVAFMAKNRLHIIECKTKRMSGKNLKGATTDTLYKLDSIKGLGGLASKTMLVSYRNLGDHSADRQRANDLRINIVDGVKIQRLKEYLKKWV